MSLSIGWPPARPVPSPDHPTVRPYRRPVVIVGTAMAGVTFAAVMIAIGQHGSSHSAAVLVSADVAGLSFLVAGVAAWWHSPESRLAR